MVSLDGPFPHGHGSLPTINGSQYHQLDRRMRYVAISTNTNLKKVLTGRIIRTFAPIGRSGPA